MVNGKTRRQKRKKNIDTNWRNEEKADYFFLAFEHAKNWQIGSSPVESKTDIE